METAGHPELAERLTRNAGFGMGLEFRESHNVLGPKNTAPVRAGQVFNVALGLSGLSDTSIKEAALQSYALQVRVLCVLCAARAASKVGWTAAAERVNSLHLLLYLIIPTHHITHLHYANPQ